MRLFELTKTKITPDDEEYYKKLAKTYIIPWNETTLVNFEFIKKIKQDCQPYLQEVGSKVFEGGGLWRGMQDGHKPRQLKTARLQDRKPRDSSQQIHDGMNEYFDSRFGHPFRNGVFVTGEGGEYGEYGFPFQIFPIGNFDYLWSTDVPDLMGTVDAYEWRPEKYRYSAEDLQERHQQMINTFIKSELTGYETKHLAAAAFSGNEIMLWCEQYYALSRTVARNENFIMAAQNIIR